MYCSALTLPATPAAENEDWLAATPQLVVVTDGATIRTDTGCVHGPAWHARTLGRAILAGDPDAPLTSLLADAIRYVADQHPQCDLTHPGTPSSAVSIVRLDPEQLDYLVLGETTLVLDIVGEGLRVVSDQRIAESALELRRAADQYPIGSARKLEALVEMKGEELAARGVTYWVAAADPAAVAHALTGQIPTDQVRRAVVCSDGAARWVDMFELGDWRAALDVIGLRGVRGFLAQVRDQEARDPRGEVFPRPKGTDDATLVDLVGEGFSPAPPPHPGVLPGGSLFGAVPARNGAHY